MLNLFIQFLYKLHNNMALASIYVNFCLKSLTIKNTFVMIKAIFELDTQLSVIHLDCERNQT